MKTVEQLIKRAEELMNQSEALTKEIKEINERADMYLKRNQEIHDKFHGMEFLKAMDELHQLAQSDKRRAIEIYLTFQKNSQEMEYINKALQYANSLN